MKGRRFRTTTDTNKPELLQRVGNLFASLINIWVFEITNIEESENKLTVQFTCKVTGKITELGEKWMEELRNEEK